MDVHDFLHVFVVLELLVRALGEDFTLLHDDDSVSEMDEVDSMSHKDAGFVFEKSLEDLHEDLLANVSIKGRDWIVHEHDI